MLSDAFGQFGEIANCFVTPDLKSEKNIMNGYVEFQEHHPAQAILSENEGVLYYKGIKLKAVQYNPQIKLAKSEKEKREEGQRQSKNLPDRKKAESKSQRGKKTLRGKKKEARKNKNHRGLNDGGRDHRVRRRADPGRSPWPAERFHRWRHPSDESFFFSAYGSPSWEGGKKTRTADARSTNQGNSSRSINRSNGEYISPRDYGRISSSQRHFQGQRAPERTSPSGGYPGEESLQFEGTIIDPVTQFLLYHLPPYKSERLLHPWTQDYLRKYHDIENPNYRFNRTMKKLGRSLGSVGLGRSC